MSGDSRGRGHSPGVRCPGVWSPALMGGISLLLLGEEMGYCKIGDKLSRRSVLVRWQVPESG
jgi:hypothetical protein